MSILRFETPKPDELDQMNASYWEGQLMGLGVLVLDADEDETGLALTLSTDLPYRAATDRYTEHVRNCSACLDTPVWDIGCNEGDRLAHLAADAMCDQAAQAARH